MSNSTSNQTEGIVRNKFAIINGTTHEILFTSNSKVIIDEMMKAYRETKGDYRVIKL